MILALDGNEANVANKVGIGQYAYEVLLNIYMMQDTFNDLQIKVYLKDQPNKQMPKQRGNWQYVVVKPDRLWTQIGLPFYLYTHKKPDVFFSPTHYAPRFSPVPRAIAIMDLSYLHYPELFKQSDLYRLKSWTRYSAEKASAIFTISQASKNDIMNIYKIAGSKIHVTYPGIKGENEIVNKNLKVMKKDEILKKYNLSERYILFVGTLQPRKNIIRLFEAFKILKGKSKFKDLELVIVGKKGWLYDDILVAPTKLGIDESVKFLDFIPDEDMPALYKNAQCFVLPSLYEGFGLPVLEAMTYDCPVATSNTSSLPEAGGDAAVYFDPANVEDIAKVVEKVLVSESMRKKMIEKGKEQIKKFSWEKTAQKTLEVLREIGERG